MSVFSILSKPAYQYSYKLGWDLELIKAVKDVVAKF